MRPEPAQAGRRGAKPGEALYRSGPVLKRFLHASTGGLEPLEPREDAPVVPVSIAGCQVTLSNPEGSAPDAQVIPTPVPLLFGRALTKGTLCPSKAGGGLPAPGGGLRQS